jgi:hypothetical protein
VLNSTPLYIIGPKTSCDLGNMTYKLNLKNYTYNYSYILNPVGRSVGKFFLAIALFLVVPEGLKLVHLGAR